MKTGLAAASLLALMGLPLQAGQTCTAMMHDQGTINSIESKGSKLTILDKHDAVLGLRWDKNTHFVMQHKTIQPADLKTGEKVIVAYVKEDKDLVARTVRVVPAHALAPEHSKTAS